MENLNSIVGKMIAKPCRTDGTVLYMREDNTLEGFDGKFNKVTKDTRTQYNSPDNLRRIFITHKRVIIQYHTGVANSKNSSLIREYSYGGELGNGERRMGLVRQLGLEKATGGFVNRVKRELEEKGELKEGEIVDLKGFGLGALYKPWVYQNTEEIYIDWLPFTCFDKKGVTDLSRCSSIEQKMMKIVGESLGIDNLEELRKRYPRLQKIVYVENLDLMYEKFKSLLNSNIDEDIDKRMMSWIDRIEDRTGMKFRESKGMMGEREAVEIIVRKDNKWIKEYSAKKAIYTFDSKLEKHFLGLVTKYDEIYGKKVEKVRSKEKGNIEKSLDTILDTQGEQGVKNVVKVALATGQCDKNQLLKELTEEGYKKYSAIIRSL